MELVICVYALNSRSLLEGSGSLVLRRSRLIRIQSVDLNLSWLSHDASLNWTASIPLNMRRLTIAGGLLSVLLNPTALALSNHTSLEDCLTASSIPFDKPNSCAWKLDVAPFNERLPYTPVAIAVPRTIAHIEGAVKCASQSGVKVSAKCGGHSYASLGLGGEDGHLVVEMDRMHEVRLSEDGETAVIQGGARLGHVATELWEQGRRAISHGTCPGYVLGPKN